ncbi:MAG: RES family NAD+ phosphorylase [Bryobacterales bacterium]|nr:RES family NAD+ phosphorylase [Bryobacterales bacterium]
MINSEGAKLTGGRWNQRGTAVIYTSESSTLTAMEVIVHHGGIPEDYVGIQVDIPDDVEIGSLDIPEGWPNLVPEEITAELGTRWVQDCRHAVLRVPSATMSISGYNYILNPAHPEFGRLSFSFEPITFTHPRLRPHS